MGMLALSSSATFGCGETEGFPVHERAVVAFAYNIGAGLSDLFGSGMGDVDRCTGRDGDLPEAAVLVLV